jgi:casein kinase 1
LTFDETPDYDFLRELFATAMKNNGDEDDGMYDWMKLNDGQGWQKTVRRNFLLCLNPRACMHSRHG